MGTYRRDKDYELERYDEYEEEESEEEEDDKREEPVSKEQQDFLKLRERLKEKFRKDLKEQTASAFGHQSISQHKKMSTTNDKFGSFFGPSQPVIASRVIAESHSMRETQHTRMLNSSSRSIKDAPSTSSQQKMHVHQSKPKVVNEVKKKAQTLKDMRDYSFLLLDDVEFPATSKEEHPKPLRHNGSAHLEDVRSSQASSKSRPSMASKPASNSHALRNSALKIVHPQSRVMPSKGAAVSKPRPVPNEARKLATGCIANGPKAFPSKVPNQSMNSNRLPVRDINDPRLKGRPSTVTHSSIQKSQYSEQRKPIGGMDKVKAEMKQTVPSSKSSMSRPTKKPLPLSKISTSKLQPKQMPQRDIREDRLKKPPATRRIDEDDDEDAIGMIRKMFGYNPNRYAGVDEDDSDMEADFSTILKEERRSSKIAKEEDEEQLRLIEEEERRERMRKKQKLSRQ